MKMGIAAYNRGSEAISRDIIGTDEDRNHKNNLRVLEKINAYPKGKHSPFISGVIRHDMAANCWWFMNREADGFSSHGFAYPTLKACVGDWNINITGWGMDEHSFFYRFEPGVKS